MRDLRAAVMHTTWLIAGALLVALMAGTAGAQTNCTGVYTVAAACDGTSCPTEPACCIPDATSGIDVSLLRAPLNVQLAVTGSITSTLQCRNKGLAFASLGTMTNNTPVEISLPQQECYLDIGTCTGCSGTLLKICGQPGQ